MLFHINAFHLDRDSQRLTLWHQLAPRMRVICALCLVFAITLTPHGYWISWGCYALGIAGLIGLSQVTLMTLLQRVAIEASFVSVVLLGTLFRKGGEVLWQWGIFQVTSEGLLILGSVTVKALLCLTVLNVLVLTTSVSSLLQALTALRMPPLLVAIFASMYRYITVLVNEFTTMRRAALSRNLMNRPQGQRLVIGNMIGSLFIRSYNRGERIHHAMLSRGYQGTPALTEIIPLRRLDWIALGLTLGLIFLGQLLPWMAQST